MNRITSRWRMLTFILIVVSYILFILILKQPNYLMLTGAIYMIITLILFLGTVVGIPGIFLHMFLKKEDAALPFYKAAVALNTKNTNILTAYGLIMLRRYKPEIALDLFERALASTKHFFYHKTIKANRALCYWKLGRHAEALESYESVYYYPDLEPITDFSLENLPEATTKSSNFYAQDFVTMAFIAIVNDELDKAEYFTHAAMELMDDYGPAYDNLGQIAFKRGDFDQAIQQFTKGLELKPNMVDSQYYLALISYEKEDMREAQKWFDTINIDNLSGLSTVTEEQINELKHNLETNPKL